LEATHTATSEQEQDDTENDRNCTNSQQDNHDTNNTLHGNGDDELLRTKLRTLSTSELSEDGDDELDEELSESAKPFVDESVEDDQQQDRPVVCDQDEEHAHRYLKLPPIIGKCAEDDDHNKHKGPCRLVEGQCALCIDDYEPGDEVVWSSLECPHAFHKECIVQWLSKGKKRCPICRHWFVPGARIDDQKKSHGDAWERASAEMTRRREEEMERRAQQQQQRQQEQEQERVDNNNSNENNDEDILADLEQGGCDEEQQSDCLSSSSSCCCNHDPENHHHHQQQQQHTARKMSSESSESDCTEQHYLQSDSTRTVVVSSSVETTDEEQINE
jgi:hypothetical protein